MLTCSPMARRPPLLAPLPETLHPCATIPRRAFCAGTAGALGLAACGGDPARLSIGGLAPGDDGGTPEPGDAAHIASPDDLASSSPQDLATKASSADLAQAPSSACATGINGGAASAITASAPKYVSSAQAYVCRDSGGLYAMSSVCPHAGCKVTHETTQFYCNCHGASFDLDGQNPTAPAFSPLKHYEMCVDDSGNVQITENKVVSASTRV